MERRVKHGRFIIEENCYQTEGLWLLRIIVTDTITGETKPVAGPGFLHRHSEEEAREQFIPLVQWWIDDGCQL